MACYSIEPERKNMLKIMDFYHLQEIYPTNREKKVLTTASKKVIYKAAEATGEFLGNKIAGAVAKSNDDKIVKANENLRNVEEVIIAPEKREEILNELRQVL